MGDDLKAAPPQTIELTRLALALLAAPAVAHAVLILADPRQTLALAGAEIPGYAPPGFAMACSLALLVVACVFLGRPGWSVAPRVQVAVGALLLAAAGVFSRAYFAARWPDHVEALNRAALAYWILAAAAGVVVLVGGLEAWRISRHLRRFAVAVAVGLGGWAVIVADPEAIAPAGLAIAGSVAWIVGSAVRFRPPRGRIQAGGRT